MSQENVDIVRGAYENFNSGNLPAVLEVMDENIEWTEPGGGNAPSGTFNGRDAVENNVFGSVPGNFDEFSVEPDEFKDEGDTVIVTGRFKGKNKSGGDLDVQFEHVVEMRDGKEIRFENKPDQEAWAKGWGG